jgi:FtsH-binding integral membrane protein
MTPPKIQCDHISSVPCDADPGIRRCPHGPSERWYKSFIQWYSRARFWNCIYGRWSFFLMVFGSPDVWCRLYNLLKDSDEKDNNEKMRNSKERDGEERCGEDMIKEFQKLYFKECDMTILAVSIPRLPTIWKLLAKIPLSQGTIFALIAVTSLLLPSLEQTHWVARAFWIFSLLAGCFSVHYACEQHREFSKLIGKTGKVKEWIRSPKCKGRCIFPCHLAVLMMSLSKRLLNFALIAYVIGLGVYLGSLWQNQLDTAAGHNDSRNILIVFLISVPIGFSCSLFGWVKNVDCCLWERFANGARKEERKV